ncbi:2-isopropylmalate synthase [Kibdelosporangium philippinense]|uniref:2-isopropylmalate synthase n=1 Tax=Kibdelosporangium philippinense TaxID=211113 RepID=A0ABS8Z3B7_9PSEU|nr:2-isopropylmalate synthase [Kibdelosporangium philippinense]
MQRRAPIWCSVDLRDGNQALLEPMSMASRQEMFRLLVRMGFKEIEVGMPVSCRADAEFLRWLVRSDAVPDDVTVQVLVPMRPELIVETVNMLWGLRRAVLQVFHPASPAQRRMVLGLSREEMLRLAVAGADLAMRLRDGMPCEILLQYAPESFTQTEPEYALDLCNAVLERWQPTAADGVRVNLPATVETFPPHEFADRIEWFHRRLAFRDKVLLSVHPHNDRGTAVAAAESAVLAGADRVEGTLFGNGERSGNVCLVTLAMNLFSQGVDPMLELGDLDDIRRTVARCTKMPIGPRQPWAGELVYTSLAGSHQDAIAKGLRERERSGQPCWEVPYLAIDPHDIGRDYQALIRLSNQSGKGGLAYVMRADHNVDLPRGVQIELAEAAKREMDEGRDLDSGGVWSLFERQYLRQASAELEASVAVGSCQPDDLVAMVSHRLGCPARLVDLVEQPRGAETVCFCQVACGTVTRWGVGIAATKQRARLSAVYSGLVRLAAASVRDRAS